MKSSSLCLWCSHHVADDIMLSPPFSMLLFFAGFTVIGIPNGAYRNGFAYGLERVSYIFMYGKSYCFHRFYFSVPVLYDNASDGTVCHLSLSLSLQPLPSPAWPLGSGRLLLCVIIQLPLTLSQICFSRTC